ncbi:MAG: DegV family protein [Ruminiclostridium sp.]
MKKISITTDCVCDLPDEYLKLHGVGIVYFYITTASGRFKDGYEITSENVIEYLDSGGERAETNAPEPEEYREFFENQLKSSEEVIHISISSHISNSCPNALAALKLMGEQGNRVHIVDSGHLSTGMGHMVIRAVEMREKGKSAEEIVSEMQALKKRVSTSFIAKNADYLYRNGRVSKAVRNICSTLSLHPVLTMKNGKMGVKALQIGNYDKSVRRYIKSELRSSKNIETKRLFITHAGCSIKAINEVRALAEKLYSFDEILVTKASATISSNCGAGTVGVLYINE